VALDYEIQMTAEKHLKEVMSVKPGETVVVYSDTASDDVVVRAMASGAMALGAKPIVIKMPTDPKFFADFPKPVRQLLNAADVVVELGGGSVILYTPTYYEMRKAGRARYTCLTSLTSDVFVGAVGRIDIEKTIRLGERLVELTNSSKEIHVISPAGTDITARNKGTKAWQQGGIARNRGDVVMLLGQVGWCPLEETVNGKVAIDGSINSPKMTIPKQPVILTVEKGLITNVEGGPEAVAFRNWLASYKNRNMYRIAHFTYGINPGVLELTGRVMTTDERLFGGFLFGFGHQGDITGGKGYKAPSHSDMIVLNPSVWLDGTQIEKNGRWVDQDLVVLSRDLKVPG